MKKGIARSFLVWVLLMPVLSFALSEAATPQPAEDKVPVELMICAAASLTDIMAELAISYKLFAPHVTLTFTFGSSGALQTQIEEGAPADVFLSAGKKQMNALWEKDLLLPGSGNVLLENKVVLIVPKDSKLALASFQDVGSDTVSLVALVEPTGVPMGQYSKQIFEYLGIWESISQKASFGSDVRQVLTWVESGDVDCGVVYLTDAMTSDLTSVVAEAPEDSSDKIIYPAAVIKSTLHKEEALAFLAFLKTAEAAKISKSYGFSPVDE